MGVKVEDLEKGDKVKFLNTTILFYQEVIGDKVILTGITGKETIVSKEDFEKFTIKM